MKKFLLPGTALVALLVAVLGGAVALGAFDGDDDGGSRDAVADEAKCAEGATDCNEGGNGIDASCLEGATDCNDNPGDSGGSALGMCAPGVTDCVDMVVNDGGDAAQTCIEGSTDCNDTPSDGGGCDPNEAAGCVARAREIVIADLEQRVPGQEITVVSAEYTEWPDASLGNPQDGLAYAQVITPGFKILMEAGGQQYEYHTDLSGNFTGVN